MVATRVVVDTRRRLGRVGAWLNNLITASAPADVQRRAVARIERLGYRSVWTGEGPGGREVFAKLGIWLAETERVVVGSGIANIWARPGLTMRAGAATFAEAYPGRFVLGVGVGFARQAERLGREYGRPLATMRRYLADMDAEPGAGISVPPSVPFPRVLAAVGPKMIALGGELADGVHPYGAPVATTALARELLGPDKLLVPEQLVIFDADQARARERARAYRARTLSSFGQLGGHTVSPYYRNLMRLGFTQEQIHSVDDDRVTDATIAHGDETAIAGRLREHLDAGADHVLVNVHEPDLPSIVDTLERLAPAVLEL